MATLFWILCLASVLSFFVPFMLSGKSALFLAVAPLILWPLYFFYESSIPAEMNIRVDLLFLYPLLIIATILAIARCALLKPRAG